MKFRVMGQVMKVLAPCLAFVEAYSPSKTHNMMAILLDPHHKTMKVIREYIGDFQASSIVEEYDRKIVLPHLIQVYKHLNLTSDVPPNHVALTNDDMFFGMGVSNDDTMHNLLKNELRLFQCLGGNPKDCENSLVWWAAHESQFLHVAFLAYQILKIVGSQIETESIFNFARVITKLRQSRLGIENLD
jgi:hypothetical protein